MGFDTPARQHMSGPVVCVGEHAPLDLARSLMAERSISALPVLAAGDERAIGVITRTDLLRVSRPRDPTKLRHGRSSLPPEPVAAHMTVGVDAIDPETPLATAAARMVAEGRRRLYVIEGKRVIGVIGTLEILEAVAAARIRTLIKDVATADVVTVDKRETVARAVERLEIARVHGLVVTEDRWPVGMFTQDDALAARGADRADPIEIWMDPSITMVPSEMPAHLAADVARHSRPHRLLTFDAATMRGIATGLDFARLLAA